MGMSNERAKGWGVMGMVSHRLQSGGSGRGGGTLV